ncbi:hypothetical protein A2773_07305 [Candidatus Gottesmanbacteria bacterium RIFCSPHIGHO2_01_FULL_39_10]|uniref:Membrane protein 6-pyruvoyl-tetrahydropterin synthase-related domain-containing protein n=1 Tax=Candidatus Gottesmanbacteria bacterium RIFCSPHIGHO2_01_FULL_39_10 TaxID=1798375 RepID=A0A1F5ZQS2_9BACT|nr:MAG: hypothetical protein A2773_07305 [Candidatus Gottesmanbacteria bacterium RIFCSPHIGHO2_01_FULL_39_10]
MSTINNKKYLPLLIFHIIFAVIVMANFVGGKYFTGWDAINPEFNLGLNLTRSIFASWQENYGLGTLGGHGFAALLPHTLVTYVLSSILPEWGIRTVFMLLCLYIGGLGMFYLFRHMAVMFFDQRSKIMHEMIPYASCIAALFYMINLGTVQIFYLPLEAYTTQFAFLPWLFFMVILLIKKVDRKRIFWFIVLNFLASISGFIPSLFAVYFLSLVILLISYVAHVKSVGAMKKAAFIILLTLIVNAYWILPLGYYQVSRGGGTTDAYSNIMSTQDFIDKNKKYGNLQNVSLLRGFYFDMYELNDYVMRPWIEHGKFPEVKILSYGFFAVVAFGFVYSILKIKNYIIKSFAFCFILFFILLNSGQIPFSFISDMLGKIVPAYAQAFRTPFTKYAVSLSFYYSIFLAVGFVFLVGMVYRIKQKLSSGVLFFILLVFIIYTFMPVFGGNLFYKKLFISIPKNYFDVMGYFRNQKDGRIADFPQDCAEGWYGYKWGYFGSGFYWYGIKQPILSRTFDVWNNSSENYYWEVINAIRSENYKNIEAIFDKYDVDWILYDPNLISCRSAKVYGTNKNLFDYLNTSLNFKIDKIIESNKAFPIYIFKRQDTDDGKHMHISEDLSRIFPVYKWNNYDKAYLEFGEYIGMDNATMQQCNNERCDFDIYYPFRSLFTGRKQEELEFDIEDKGNQFVFKAQIPKSLEGYSLLIPPTLTDEVREIDANDLDKSVEKPPEVYLDGERLSGEVLLKSIKDGKIEVRVPKVTGYYSANINADNFVQSKPISCDEFNKGEFSREIISEASENFLRFSSKGSSNCLDVPLPYLTHRLSYLVSVKSRNIEGKSLLFAVINKNSERADVETYLPKETRNNNQETNISYFVIPPMEQFGAGYTLHFDNISIGRVKTINDLGEITVNSLPYNFLTSIKIVNNQSESVFSPPSAVDNSIFKVDHPNPSYYQIEFNNETMKQCNNERCTLVLSQSYDEGWKAYELSSDSLLLDSWYMKLLIPIFGKEMKDHVLVNNWSNGWKLNDTMKSTVAIVYLPQYLEYIGFGFLGGLIIYLIVKRKTRLD